MKYELISMLINLNMNQQLYIDAHLPSRVFIIKIQEQTMCLDQLVRQRLPIHISKKNLMVSFSVLSLSCVSPDHLHLA